MDHQPACSGLDDTTTSEQCVTFGFYPQLTLPSVCIPTSGRAMSSEKMYETAEKKRDQKNKKKTGSDVIFVARQSRCTAESLLRTELSCTPQLLQSG